MKCVEEQDISWWRQCFTERLMAVQREDEEKKPQIEAAE